MLVSRDPYLVAQGPCIDSLTFSRGFDSHLIISRVVLLGEAVTFDKVRHQPRHHLCVQAALLYSVLCRAHVFTPSKGPLFYNLRQLLLDPIRHNHLSLLLVLALCLRTLSLICLVPIWQLRL